MSEENYIFNIGEYYLSLTDKHPTFLICDSVQTDHATRISVSDSKLLLKDIHNL